MTEIKARLHGGVEERKRKGAEVLKAILDKVKHEGVIAEGELAVSQGMERKELAKYIQYLREKGLISVKKRIFGEAEISVSGGAIAIEKKNEAEKTTEKKEEPKDEAKEKKEPEQPEPPAKKDEAHTEQPSQQGMMAAGGEKVVPETAEEFNEVCKSLVTDFSGVMRLYCESQNQTYTAALLINAGEIIAASFEHLDEARVICGDDAMGELQAEFMGTKGDLEIFEMTEEDYNSAVRANIDCTLQKPMKLSVLKIRIKSNLTQDVGQESASSLTSRIKGMFSSAESDAKAQRQEMLRKGRHEGIGKIQGSLNLMDFARSLKLDPEKAKRFEELRKLKIPDLSHVLGSQDERKAQRLEELKMQKENASTLKDSLLAAVSPQERPQRDRGEKPQPIKIEGAPKPLATGIKEGKKVETSIDRLYELVEQHGKVKINDALAAKLKVNKTQIEQWAMILEEHNLMELRYPTIGEPEIISIHADKSNKSEDTDGRKKN